MKIYLYICNHCIRLNNLVMKEYLTLAETSEYIGKVKKH